jgi:monoamine oxidase
MKVQAPSAETEVLIVGAGIAGLYAAYRLLQANISFRILEADDHAGGRIKSRKEKNSQLGLVLDEGANLINSTDRLAIKLMNQFGINYVRRLKSGMDGMHYLVAGEEYNQERFDQLLFAESRIAINHITADQEIWRDDKMRDINPKFIDESIASYLKRIEAGPILRVMLKSFFWSEYGYEIDNLNLHVLFDYLQIDMSCPCFMLIPNVDEAYTVPGGTGQITSNLEKICHEHVMYNRRVNIIDEVGGVIHVSSTNADQQTETHTAKHVLYAAPLHSLKNIKVMVEGLAAKSVELASAASYANGAKLHLKFEPGFDKLYRYSGILLTDTGEQIWTSSTGQGGAGLLTVLTGPVPPGQASAVEYAGRVLLALDKICPGLSELYVGVERSDAPMSYSGSLRPGEAAHLAIVDGAKHWTTIGEAASGELQGYLEGALRSADDAVTRYVLGRRAKKTHFLRRGLMKMGLMKS